MKKAKTTKKDDEISTSEESALHVFAPIHRYKKVAAITILLLLISCGLMWAANSYNSRSNAAKELAQPGGPVKELVNQTPAEEAKAAESSSLPSNEKAMAIIAAAFKSFRNGDYKTAQSLTNDYVSQAQYRKDILCNMYLSIYEAQQKTDKVTVTANECVKLFLKNQFKDELSKQLNNYRVGYFYEKAGNTAEAKKYFAKFVSYIEESKQQNLEVVSGLYEHAKEAIQ